MILLNELESICSQVSHGFENSPGPVLIVFNCGGEDTSSDTSITHKADRTVVCHRPGSGSLWLAVDLEVTLFFLILFFQRSTHVLIKIKVE